MYITRNTKQKNLPQGHFILRCENYVDNQGYFLINGKLAKNTVYNTAYALKYDKITLKQLKKDGIYKAYKILEEHYKLYNLN